MLIHIVGVGSVGSLVATQLSLASSNIQLQLIVRSRELLRKLSPEIGGLNDDVRSKTTATVNPVVNRITIQQDEKQISAGPFELELLPYPRHVYPIPGHAKDRFHIERTLPRVIDRDNSFARRGAISSLIVASKAHEVSSAIEGLLPRLSKDSTIVLLQNGAGLVETLTRDFFPDEYSRPSFIVGVNSHGAWVKRWPEWPSPGDGTRQHREMLTVWAGVGEIAFATLANVQVREAIAANSSPSTASENPIYDAFLAKAPSLNDIPVLPQTASLRSTIAALLAATSLKPRWTSCPELQTQQQVKVAVNCVVNPLTVIYDTKNGIFPASENARALTRRICEEISRVYAAQSRLQLIQRMRNESASADLEKQAASLGVDERQLFDTEQFAPDHHLHASSLYARVLQVAAATSSNISSTLQDVRLGRTSTEIDYLNGYIVRLGQAVNVPTPVNESLIDMVKYKLDIAALAAKECQKRPYAVQTSVGRKIVTDQHGTFYLPQGVPSNSIVDHRSRRGSPTPPKRSRSH